MKNEELIRKVQKLPMDCEILGVDIVKYSRKSNEAYFEEAYVPHTNTPNMGTIDLDELRSFLGMR